MLGQGRILPFLFLLWMCGASRGRSPPALPSPDALRKELVKAQILQRLGLPQKPTLDLSHQIPREVVLETLRRTQELEAEQEADGGLPGQFRRENGTQGSTATAGHKYAKTSEIISFPDKGPVLNGQPLLSFSFAGENAFGVGVRVKRAGLWIKMDYRASVGRDWPHLLHPKPITLYVFQVTGNFSALAPPPLLLSTQEVNLDLATSRTLSLGSLGWQKLDLTPVVQKWYGKLGRHRVRHHHHHGRAGPKLTLLVDCSGCGNSIYPVMFGPPPRDEAGREQRPSPPVPVPVPPTPDPGTDLPFLVLETESAQSSRRSRRLALECSDGVRQCCKQKFFISFQDLGWDDWIIAPRGYYANYCRGTCGGAHRTPDTFLNYHTHVMEEYRRTEAGRSDLSGLTPCCAPTKFSALSLIYFGPDLNIIKRDLPKMIVEECGCP